MILLPDMTFEFNGIEHKLSLQDPYTLNEKLITNINIVSEPEEERYDGRVTFQNPINTNTRIQIGNEEGYYISIFQNDLLRYFQDKIAHFFYEQRSNEVRVGENQRFKWTIRRSYGFFDYIRDVIKQCDDISRDRNYFPHERYTTFILCKERLRNQGRLREESNRTEYVYSRSPSHSYLSSASFEAFNSAISRFGTTVNSFNDSNNSYISAIIREPLAQNNKYIHEYNYKPEYIKHYMPDENEFTLLLGAEIEVAGNDRTDLNKEEVVKKCIQIINGSDDDSEDLIYSTSDSTVQIELDTMPCTLNYHKQMNYKKLFKYLDELGYKGHDCNNAGLHIHADRSYLGNTELKQQLVITKILYILEKFNDEICVIARRNNSYSQFVGKEEVKKTLDVLYGKYKNYGKKVALNLQHKDTIEFRCFRSTLKYETFILTLEFVKDIIDYAKSVNIEEIELIQWSDLMDTFSDELKEYYNDRFEKEKKKEEEKKKDNSPYFTLGEIYGSGVVRSYGRIINGDILTTATSIDADNSISSISYSPYIRRLAASSESSASATLTLDSVPISSASTYSTLFGLDVNHSSFSSMSTEIERVDIPEDPIESKKKEIKSLKKRISNSRNYMEKMRLNAELTQAQKELKKLKREINNSNCDDANNSNDTIACTATIANSDRPDRNNRMYRNYVEWCS